MRPSLFACSLALVPLLVFAHGDKPSLEKTVNGYLIDIGYDQEGFRPGEDVKFDFDLFADSETDHPSFAPFESITVAIVKETQTIFTKEILNNPTYVPSLTYAFPVAGDYDFNVAYNQSGAVIAEATFPLSVEENAGAVARSQNMIHYIAAAILVLFTVIAVGRSYLRR